MKEKTQTQNRRTSRTENPPRTIRILHVDDSPDFIEMASAFLHREGDYLEVHTRTDPQEAVSFLRDEQFDCVVSDCTMPDMEIDGLEFRSEVRSVLPDLPFVFFTGRPYHEFPEEVLSDESTTHLKKEIDVKQFTRLSEHLREVVSVGTE